MFTYSIIFCIRINVAHLESMAKIHSFLITNARNELKFVETEVSQEKLPNTFDEIAD